MQIGLVDAFCSRPVYQHISSDVTFHPTTTIINALKYVFAGHIITFDLQSVPSPVYFLPARYEHIRYTIYTHMPRLAARVCSYTRIWHIVWHAWPVHVHAGWRLPFLSALLAHLPSAVLV
jgi:hypothetical protein